jgi:molecular chaperone DnaK (HSP70)
MARFAVGIDLGTTNTVIASAGLDGARAHVFPVPQLVTPGQIEGRELFPSMLYAGLESERIDDPFDDAPWVLGELARRRGSEVPGRLVASSKSWLVHAGIDRAAAVLPWGAAEDAPRLSPVEAAARVLAHVRGTWDAAHPEARLAEQEVVLTVPASFDEVARELTLRAAHRAGLAPKLLEEPQAAFYDWMARAGREGLTRLLAETRGQALVLVVDVGGGTTDLSLVRVSSVDTVSRVAVGPHLLLGGDNMDLALAHGVEPRLVDPGEKLDPARFAQLVSGCRLAKEKLLGEAPPPEMPVTVLGAGAKLVGSARTARVAREEVERIVLDGFFPAVSADARPQRVRSALVAFGLPYERDVAITRHLASFLARHLPSGEMPNALLLNGGVFRAARIAERVVQLVERWRQERDPDAAGRGGPLVRLPDADPDLAVARGAVAYALARLGRGVRIGGGTARSYFVGVADTDGERRAVCVVPRGAEEGIAYATHGRSFALAVGRPVRFDLLASDEVDAHAGDVVTVDEDRFERLPPVAATLDAAAGEEIRVALEGELTPVGTLDLACAEMAGEKRRFRLAFQLRDSVAPDAPATPSRPPSLPAPASRLEAATDLLDRAFGKPRADATGREAKDLLRELERVLGERAQWTTETNRALFDALLPAARARRRSADHERIFWLLAGWCVRPGFGAPRDAQRVGALAPLFDERLAFPAEARGWQQFWIAWRRAAGGLDEPTQTRIRDFADPYLAPPEAGLKKPKKPALALEDALDVLSSLERVDPRRRSALGGWLLERTWTDRDPRLWAAIGRLGARVPAYASVHHVVGREIAERWLEHLLREKWDTAAASPGTRRSSMLPLQTAARAAVQLARCTGDRARDVSDRLRREVAERLRSAGATDDEVRAVQEVVAVDEGERVAFFGDALPPGLRLVE